MMKSRNLTDGSEIDAYTTKLQELDTSCSNLIYQLSHWIEFHTKRVSPSYSWLGHCSSPTQNLTNRSFWLVNTRIRLLSMVLFRSMELHLLLLVIARERGIVWGTSPSTDNNHNGNNNNGAREMWLALGKLGLITMSWRVRHSCFYFIWYWCGL